MTTKIILSDLLVDLSTEQQQLLTGGQAEESDDLLDNMGFGAEGDEQDTTLDGEQLSGQGLGTTNQPTRRYRIRSQSTKVISVQRL